jgi:hypothetical protein
MVPTRRASGVVATLGAAGAGAGEALHAAAHAMTTSGVIARRLIVIRGAL